MNYTDINIRNINVPNGGSIKNSDKPLVSVLSDNEVRFLENSVRMTGDASANETYFQTNTKPLIISKWLNTQPRAVFDMSNAVVQLVGDASNESILDADGGLFSKESQSGLNLFDLLDTSNNFFGNTTDFVWNLTQFQSVNRPIMAWHANDNNPGSGALQIKLFDANDDYFLQNNQPYEVHANISCSTPLASKTYQFFVTLPIGGDDALVKGRIALNHTTGAFFSGCTVELYVEESNGNDRLLNPADTTRAFGKVSVDISSQAFAVIEFDTIALGGDNYGYVKTVLGGPPVYA